MADLKEEVQRMMNELKQQRDELRLKMHLAQADARDEWEKLEARWDDLEAKFEANKADIKAAAEETSENVGAALKGVFEELKKGYDRIRHML